MGSSIHVLTQGKVQGSYSMIEKSAIVLYKRRCPKKMWWGRGAVGKGAGDMVADVGRDVVGTQQSYLVLSTNKVEEGGDIW